MRNIKLLAHRHRLPGGGFTEQDYLRDNPCGTSAGGGFEDELGFIDPISLIGGAVGAIGDLVGGDKKGRGGAAAAAPALAIAPLVDAIGQKVVGEDQLKSIVRNLLESVPSPVKQQVREVIKAVQAEGGSLKQAEAKLVQNIETKFLPQISKAMEALKLAQTQRLATSEHNSIARTAGRWDQSARRQKKILAKQKKIAADVARLEAIVTETLANNKLVPPRAVRLAGGSRHLDILAGKR
jgi:hypothetical protein